MNTSAPQARPSGAGRRCTRSGCSEVAVSTLTYIYAESTAVIGPLSTFAEPHAFDLCNRHSESFKVPNGWTVISHDGNAPSGEPTTEDLMAIANAVREVGKSEVGRKYSQPEIGRRGHLRAIPNQE